MSQGSLPFEWAKPEVVKKKRRLAPKRNDPKHDLVETPADLARAIVEYHSPRGRLLDPARGNGVFYQVMLAHSSDVRWCEITEGRDFFSYREPVDWIVTNPPWSKMRPFLRHAMKLAPNVVFLGTVSHFVLKARLRDMDEAGFGLCDLVRLPQPPAPWPGSGFQPAVGLFRKGAANMIPWLSDARDVPLRRFA
jgi:hypothetical protein